MIDKADILNPNALVIDRGEVIAAPGGNIPPRLAPWEPAPDEWVQRQVANERAAQKRQYDMEVESAERLRRMQELEAFLAAGISPPKIQNPQQIKPELLKSGDDIWAIDPFTGATKMLVKGRESEQRLRGYTPDQMGSTPLGEGWEWGPSAYPGYFEPFRLPKKSSIEELLAGGDVGAPSPTPARTPASSRYRVVERK